MSEKNEPGQGGKSTPKIFAKINEDTTKMLLESILPKLLPFVESAAVKIDEFLGENEKTIVMFRIKGKTKVLVLNNTVGKYAIVNDSVNKQENKFSVEEDSVENVFDVKEFAEKLLRGDFNLG